MSVTMQVWTAMPCESGAYAMGGIPRWQSAQGTEARGAAPMFRLVCPTQNNGAASSLAVGRILRVLSLSRAEQFWLVTAVDGVEGKGEGLVSVTCGSIRQLLATRGLVRTQSVTGGPWVYDFTPGRRLVDDHLTDYVFSNLSADGLSWWSAGANEYAPPITLAAFSRARRGAVLDSIETQTGYFFVPRLVYSGSTLTGVALDLLEDPASALATRTLEVGGSITTLQQTQELSNAPTVVVPFTASGTGMEHPAWEIGAVTGAGPYWTTLLDPDGGALPIREDDQCIGAYLLTSGGTTHAILDSRASDSAVQTTANTGLSAGGIVSIVIDTSGRPLTELTSPSGVAGSRGRVVAEVGTLATHAARNLIVNPLFDDWSSVSAPSNWTGTGGTFNAGEYARDTPSTLTGILVNGSNTIGAAGIAFRNAVPNALFFANEYFVVGGGGGTFRVGNVVAQANGSGTGSIVFASGTLAATVPDGTTITFFGQDPYRPTSFPTNEPLTNNAIRLLTNSGLGSPPSASGVRLQSDAIAVKYAAGWETLNCAAAFTMMGGDSPISASLPGVMLNNTTGPTRLAYAYCSGTIAATTLVHETVSCSYTMSADITVAVCLLGGSVQLGQCCRWVSLWLGDATQQAPYQHSGTNLLWHRGQDVLARLTNAGRFRIAGVDLQVLLGGQGPLALGQMVRVRSSLFDATLRIVQMDYTLGQDESLALEVGALTPKLTGVTVSL